MIRKEPLSDILWLCRQKYTNWCKNTPIAADVRQRFDDVAGTLPIELQQRNFTCGRQMTFVDVDRCDKCLLGHVYVLISPDNVIDE